MPSELSGGMARRVAMARALAGGGPLYYFLSAVFLGMAYASMQRGKGGKGGRGQ